MREQVPTGMNRTGVQMSPFDTAELERGIRSLMPAAPGDMEEIARMRSASITDADELGSVPPPGTMRGMLTTGTAALLGKEPQLLLDKLGERLAFERAGVRLYEALIDKVEALERAGTATAPVPVLIQIRDEEAQHFALVARAIQSVGGDPTVQTPCADLVGIESGGLLQAVSDPRTTVAQSLHAILVAEMADNSGWEILIALAHEQLQDAMVADFSKALANERDHLRFIRETYETAIFGGPLTTPP